MAILITSMVNMETWEEKANRLSKNEREGTDTPSQNYQEMSVVWNPMWDGPIEEYKKNPKFKVSEI